MTPARASDIRHGPPVRRGAHGAAPDQVRAARDGWDFSAEFAAYRELAEAREVIRAPAATRRQLANAVRVLRTSDDMDDRKTAENLAIGLDLTEREIAGQSAIAWVMGVLARAGGL